jgi:hypothetical protein
VAFRQGSQAGPPHRFPLIAEMTAHRLQISR